jgi:hypothetical protein
MGYQQPSLPPDQHPNPEEPRGFFDAGRWAGDVIGFVVDRIEAADSEGATRTVRELRERYPHWDDGRLVAYLISRKARQTALIGAATAGGSLLPGLGTLLSITVGMAADIGASVKLHAELVLEIAAVRGRVLSPDERRQAVGLAMGISAAQSQLVARGVRAMTTGLIRRYGTQWLAKGVPFLGAATSAVANSATTTVIGRRADAYLRLPPDRTDEPEERLQVLTGIDPRRATAWLQGATSRLRPDRNGELPPPDEPTKN